MSSSGLSNMANKNTEHYIEDKNRLREQETLSKKDNVRVQMQEVYTKRNNKELKQRDTKWDNIKFILITCVVTGHMIYLFLGDSVLAKGIYLWIYSFHMPAFLFLSGMFSKHAVETKNSRRILDYLAIYLLMKTLQSVANYFVNGKVTFRFFWEAGPGWYALAMAVYIFISSILKDVDKRKLLLLAVLAGCMAGYDNHLGDHFASARIVTFYPFFLLGLYLEPEEIKKTMKKPVRVISGIILFATFLITILYTERFYWMLKLFKGKYAYAQAGVIGLRGPVYRFLLYIGMLLMAYCVFAVISSKKKWYSDIGRNTLPIFIFHPVAIIVLMNILQGKRWLYTFYPVHYVIAAVILSWILVIVIYGGWKGASWLRKIFESRVLR